MADLLAVAASQPAGACRPAGSGVHHACCSGTMLWCWQCEATCACVQVYLINVTASYFNPSPLDTCEQYNSKVVFGLRQAYNESNVVMVNKTGGKLIGPINITVAVIDGKSNASGATQSLCWQLQGSACCRAVSPGWVLAATAHLSTPLPRSHLSGGNALCALP